MRYPDWTVYDPAALHAQYNNRGKVPDYAGYAARWAATSEALRGRARAKLDIAYGARPAEAIDLFMPEAGNPPLHIFIHGGYWQYNDRKPFAFIADAMTAAGAAVATVGYPLTPAVTMTELVDCVRTGIALLWRQAGALGFDRDRMHVSGNSAGGHLTATMMLTDWPAFAADLPTDLLKSGIAISGIYDLEPIRHTPIGDAPAMDAAEARALSPLFMPPPTRAPLIIALGGEEGPEFHRQAEAFAAHLVGDGVEATILDVPGANHFSIVDDLAAPGTALHAAARRFLGVYTKLR
jgi:arylformamidase